MHKPVLVTLSTEGNTPGHLANLGEELGSAGHNIAVVGGAESAGNGAVALLFDDDSPDKLADIESIVVRLGYTYRDVAGVTVQLMNVPGALGVAARKLADAEPAINIEAVLYVGARGSRALVCFGVAEEDEQRARDALSDHTILDD